nr:hypothetical protein [Tanacetum cinerariifolium]
MVAYLTKFDASEGFNQILDFLNGISIKYYLTVNPNIYVSCVKQFWTTVTVKKVNDVIRLQAQVDKKKVVVTKATIREVLRLDDAEGVECLPNEEIFAELARIGYEKPSTQLTFYKALFSSQWKVGKGFSGVDTPLFEGMLVAQEVEEGNVDENVENVNTGDAAEGDVSAAHDEVPTADEEPYIPSPTPPTLPPQPSQEIPSTSQAQPTPPQSPHVQPPSPQPQQQPQPTQDARIPMNLLQEVMDTCTALSRRVKHLELDKIAQALEITKLKRRIKKLEMRNKRMIAKMDQDADVVLEEVKEVADDAKADRDAKVDESVDIQGRKAESQAEIYNIDLEHANKVLSIQEDESEPAEVQEVVDVVTTVKIITEVVIAASETITAASITITAAKSSTSTIKPAKTKSKDKGKGILLEEPKPLKKQAQIKQDEQYARELEVELNRTIYLDKVIDHVKMKAKEDPAVKRVETSNDTMMDDVSNQERMIAKMDQDADVVLEEVKEVADDAKADRDAKVDESVDIQGRKAESQAEIYNIDLEHANKVLSIQEDESEPAEVQEVVDVVTTVKIITEVVIAASETITAASITITAAKSSTSTIKPAKTKSKDKGKGILLEEPKPLKKQAQIKQDEQYARELEVELNRTIYLDKVIDHVKMKAKEDPAVKRYQALKRKPQTEAQARKNMMIYLKNVAGRKYPIIRFTLDQMLNAVRLEVEEESEASLELLRRLTMEEMLGKFIDEGKRKHEKMEIFIKEFRTTNELLLKEQNNLLRVTTRGGRMTSKSTPSNEINEFGIYKNEPPRFEQDVQEKPHDVGVENKYSSIPERTTQRLVKPQQSSILFRNRLRKEREEAQQRKLEEACMITMNERCSIVLLNKLPSKEKKPRNFTIHCQGSNLQINNALVDLGASISLMPYTMYEKLGLGEPKLTRMSLELVDRSIQYPKEIVKNMLIKVDKIFVPIDFVILDMPEDSRILIISWRPFFPTTHAMIDVFNRNITLRVGDDEVIFDMDQSMKRPPTEDNECYGIDDLDDTINMKNQKLFENDQLDSFLLKDLEKSIN